MGLLDRDMGDCVLLAETAQQDGRGGAEKVWTEGSIFRAAVVLDNSMEARRAEAQGVTAVYTVTTRRAVCLRYHDVFRRTSDGRVFRVTSDGDDKRTPDGAGLDMRQVSAEAWELPEGG